jgi:tetratricopeptide (TPR) repeat protein
MDLLGVDGQPLPRAHWSPLSLAMEQSLLSRSGLISFAHDYLRRAVQNINLHDLSFSKSAHLRLADYFKAQSGQSSRYLDELPWQLVQARDWQRLYALLGDLEFFKAAWDFNPWEAKAYWAQVEANSPYLLLDAYHMVIDHPAENQDYVYFISQLLADTGHLEQAFYLRSYLVEYYRKTGDKVNLQTSLGNQANILYFRSDLDGAMALYKEKELICRELGVKAGLQASLGNQATILYARGDLDGAMALNKEAERICRELGNKDGLHVLIGNQALIMQDRGDLDGAMSLNKEAELICRELGNKDGLQLLIGNQANILYFHGDLDGAMALHKEEENLCRELGNKDGLPASLNNQALILQDRGNLDGAMALHKEAERICREMGNKDGVQRTLSSQGDILQTRGDLDGAMAMFKEQERICRELGLKDGLQLSLGNQGNILKKRVDLDGAMALYKEQERICRELGNKESLADLLMNQASILGLSGNQAKEALFLADEAYRLAAEHGYAALTKQIEEIRAKIRERLGDK